MIEERNNKNIDHEYQISMPPFGTDRLLSYDEFLTIRNLAGNTFATSYIKKLKFEYNRWFQTSYITPESFNQKYIDGEFDRDTKMWDTDRIYIREYILVNMLWGRIPFDKEFIKEETIKSGLSSKIKYLELHYKNNRPHYLPQHHEISWKSNTFFAYQLSLFYKKEELTEEIIIHCFFDTVRNANDEKLDEKIKDFSLVFYPIFIKHGLMDKKSDIIRYLYKISSNSPQTEDEEVWKYFNRHMNNFQETEFYDVCKSFVQECLSKKNLHKFNIQYAIRAWKILSDICLTDTIEPCISIRDISGYHRDCFLDFIEEGINNYIASVRRVLSHYNSHYVKDKMFVDVDIFKNSLKKVRENSKIQLMETGMGALCSVIFEEILLTRKNSFNEMTIYQKNHFFIVRILWLTCIYAGRITEIRNLKINDVENSIKYKEPYFIIKTLKDTHDRPIQFERGKKLDYNETKHEYDWLHLDILQETINAAKSVYEEIGSIVETKYLFPGTQLYQPINYKTVYNFHKNLQSQNGIVCGSSYDIRMRDQYIYHPHLKKLLNNPLFNIHHFRHFTVEILRKYAFLTKEEITRFYGWKSSNTENTYGEYSKAGFKAFKVLEREGHLDASNKLVPSTLKREISNDVNRMDLANIEDLENYLSNVDSGNFLNIDDANKHIDENTDCQTEVACGDTGIRCTGCDHFRTGEETTLKKDAISFIIEDAYKKIEQEIINLNLDKKDLLKKSKSSKKLLMDAFISILIRFEEIEATKNISLLSNQQGFGWSEATANRFLVPIFKKTRKTDLDKLLINRIKELRKEGFFNERVEELRGDGDLDSFIINIFLYRNIENKVVFR